jgi:hypothetical protein
MGPKGAPEQSTKRPQETASQGRIYGNAGPHRGAVASAVVTASLRGLDIGEVVCTPGVERADL